MATVVTPEALYFGAPASLLINGVEMGATLDNPKVGFEIEKYTPRFKNAGGPVKGAGRIKSVIPTLECLVNELSAAKLAHAMPGSVQTVGTGSETASGINQALAADAVLGASVIKFPGVTLANPSAEADDIVDTVTAHGFVAGQRVMFQSITGGAGLLALTPYYVIAGSLGATTLKLSLTSGGAAINFTTDITAGVLIPAYAAGQFIRVGDAGETEIHVIATAGVGTSGSGGTGLTFTTPLVRSHDEGDEIQQMDDAGTSLFSWSIGAIPEASYVDVEAIGIGTDGRQLRVKIKDALAGDSFSFPMGDDDYYGVPLKFTGNYDPAAPTVVPYEIEVG